MEATLVTAGATRSPDVDAQYSLRESSSKREGVCFTGLWSVSIRSLRYSRTEGIRQTASTCCQSVVSYCLFQTAALWVTTGTLWAYMLGLCKPTNYTTYGDGGRISWNYAKYLFLKWKYLFWYWMRRQGRANHHQPVHYFYVWICHSLIKNIVREWRWTFNVEVAFSCIKLDQNEQWKCLKTWPQLFVL